MINTKNEKQDINTNKLKNMKLLLITMLTMLCLNSVNAQSHVIKPDVNCKLNKVKYGTEAAICPACANIDKKEKEAKEAEDKRRADAIVAKAKAEHEAMNKAREDKLKQEKEDEDKRKEKEESDKIARDAMMKRYNEIAEKGRVKSTVKGEAVSTDFSIDKIETFNDEERRIYGFKIAETEILTFPFENFQTNISRLQGSNFFTVDVYSSVEVYAIDPKYKYRAVYSHSYLVNYLGEKLEIDGRTTFDYKIQIYENTIYLMNKLGSPEIVDNPEKHCYRDSYDVISIYESRSSALAGLESLRRRGAGLAMCFNYLVCHVNQYKVNLNGKLIGKNEGYQLRLR